MTDQPQIFDVDVPLLGFVCHILRRECALLRALCRGLDLLVPGHNIVLTLAQDASIRPDLVPRKGMTFTDIDDAYRFYARYAMEAGFGIKKYRVDGRNKWLNCVRQGSSISKKKDGVVPRKTTSKRTGCNAALKLKQVSATATESAHLRLTLFNEAHNHPLMSTEAARHCHSAKSVHQNL